MNKSEDHKKSSGEPKEETKEKKKPKLAKKLVKNWLTDKLMGWLG